MSSFEFINEKEHLEKNKIKASFPDCFINGYAEHYSDGSNSKIKNIIKEFSDDNSSEGSWSNSLVIDQEYDNIDEGEHNSINSNVTEKKKLTIDTSSSFNSNDSSNTNTSELNSRLENGLDSELDSELDSGLDSRLDSGLDSGYSHNEKNKIFGKLITSPLSKSSFNLKKIQSFESKLPSDISVEKKMSLLIVVLLQMVFNGDNSKLDKIYKFLAKKKLLDLEVTRINYVGIRKNLSFMIEKMNYDKNDKNDSPGMCSGNSPILSEYNESPVGFKTKYINKYRNNFNQLNLIGRGGYGSVYKAYHKFEKKFYAVKKIFIVQDLLSEGYDIFNEIQLYSELNHTNIVRYYTSWVDIDLNSILEFNKTIDISSDEPINKICPILFIQMELCSLSLKEYFLTIGSDDTIQIKINYFKQILNGVEYLHSNELIHRDIKPDNIFMVLDKNNNYIVKIGDFGLSRKFPYPSKLQSIKDFEYNQVFSLLKELENDIPKNKSITNFTFQSQSHLNKLISPKSLPVLAENEYNDNSESNISNISNVSNISDKIEVNQLNELNELNELDQLGEFSEIIQLELSKDIGTGIYRAPEIFTGYYNNKVDVYSLGILLIEFLLEYKTNHEKILKLREILIHIKENTADQNPLPYLLTNQYDYIIKKSLDQEPENRPTVTEIINFLN